MSDTCATSERRTNDALRLIFPVVCEALRPFFDATNHWQGQSHEHLAYRTLKERFPELSGQDSFVAVTTVKRLFATDKFPPAP